MEPAERERLVVLKKAKSKLITHKEPGLRPDAGVRVLEPEARRRSESGDVAAVDDQRQGMAGTKTGRFFGGLPPDGNTGAGEAVQSQGT